jgi:acetoin utilization protein AcuB
MMRVRDVTAGQVMTVAAEASLSRAADLMRACGLRHLPVVDHGRLVGVLSDLDLDAAWPSAGTTLTVGEIASRLSEVRVDSAMQRDVVTVRLETPIVEAARLLRDRRVGALPVVRRGEVVGMVTESQILAAMAELLEGSDASQAG